MQSGKFRIDPFYYIESIQLYNSLLTPIPLDLQIIPKDKDDLKKKLKSWCLDEFPSKENN